MTIPKLWFRRGWRLHVTSTLCAPTWVPWFQQNRGMFDEKMWSVFDISGGHVLFDPKDCQHLGLNPYLIPFVVGRDWLLPDARQHSGWKVRGGLHGCHQGDRATDLGLISWIVGCQLGRQVMEEPEPQLFQRLRYGDCGWVLHQHPWVFYTYLVCMFKHVCVFMFNHAWVGWLLIDLHMFSDWETDHQSAMISANSHSWLSTTSIIYYCTDEATNHQPFGLRMHLYPHIDMHLVDVDQWYCT